MSSQFSCHERRASARLVRARRMRRVLVTASVVLAGLGQSALAEAEPSASDRATARALAGEGYGALKKKDYATAEDRFRRADALVHAPTLVVDHARALVGLGRLAEAYEEYGTVVKEDVPADAPPVWKRAAADALRELEPLAAHVAWLTVSVTGPPHPDVEVDGRAWPQAALGQRWAADPGERHVVVSAPGFVTQEATLVLSAGAPATFAVELLPEATPAPVVVPAPVVRAPAEDARERTEKRDRTLAYVSFGVSGLGLATGAVAGILWLKSRNDITSACGGLKCAAPSDSQASRYNDDKRRYDTFGTISGVGFAVGVAGAGAAVALLLLEPKADAAAPPKAATIEPYWGLTSFGARGSF